MIDLMEYIKRQILLGDGAMGTELYRRGVPGGHCYDELNLSNPGLIERIHRDYISAGAMMIETNTFGANRHILGVYFDLGDKAFAICEKGARIARAAVAWRDILVAGSIGPITRPFESENNPGKDELAETFSEQIAALVQGGVDMLILETFADIEEMVIAFGAAKEQAPGLPVICSMSFVEGARTVTGVEPGTAAAGLIAEGAKIVGANCGAGPRGVFEAVKGLAIKKDMTLSAIPNAGLPAFSDGRFEYTAGPDYMAHYARKFATAGVSIIGGCCGTRPEHIKAMAGALEGIEPGPIPKIFPIEERVEKAKIERTRTPTAFERAIESKFVYTMEIDPPRGVDSDSVIGAAKNFISSGGDAVNISDIPMARLRMAALPLAAAIRRGTGIEVILHVTARDRNLIAIQSDILGAHTLGIRNVLALRGDPPSIGDYPFATGVYDVTSEGIVSIVSAFSQGVDRLGVNIDMPADYYVGVAVNQNAGNFERELVRLEGKIAAGAAFVQTQPVFDIEKLKKLAESLDGRVKLIAGLMILASERHAEFIHNEVPGIAIPDDIRKRIRGLSGKKGRECGLEIARETLDHIRNIADGVCIMAPFGRYELARELLP